MPDANATLWRYMSFAKFCSLLDRKALFFSLVADMEDRYEGFVCPPTPRKLEDRLQDAERIGHGILRKIVRSALISCWTEYEWESSLMWETYASTEGVAVRTSFQDLQDSICSAAELPIAFGRVEYADYSMKDVPRLGLAPLLHKRMEYRGEAEVRAILPGPPYEISDLSQSVDIPLDSDVAAQRGRYVPVDLKILVKEVVLPPHVAPWFEEVVTSTLQRSPVNPRVTRSSLELPPQAEGQ